MLGYIIAVILYCLGFFLHYRLMRNLTISTGSVTRNDPAIIFFLSFFWPFLSLHYLAVDRRT